MRPVAALKFLLLDFIIALRKFVQSGTTRKPTRGTTLAHLRSIPGSVASHPQPLTLSEVTGVTQMGH